MQHAVGQEMAGGGLRILLLPKRQQRGRRSHGRDLAVILDRIDSVGQSEQLLRELRGRASDMVAQAARVEFAQHHRPMLAQRPVETCERLRLMSLDIDLQEIETRQIGQDQVARQRHGLEHRLPVRHQIAVRAAE